MATPPVPGVSSAVSRLKREDCHRTKHDSAFSKWKVLIGPSDWSNYEAGMEGAERYRVQNLPASSGPGLYEIGVAVWRTQSGREVVKLDLDQIVVVYLGEADSVRSRLQMYGRGGAHLENCSYSSSVDLAKGSPKVGAGFFKDIFSRGYAIVYRWAPMSSKIDAKRKEAQLLDTFDYAWNKVGNCRRRPNDILQKIDEISSRTVQLPRVVKKLQALSQKQVGIPIKARQLPLLEDKHCGYAYDESYNLFSRVFKFGRSHPRLASDQLGVPEDFTVTFFCRATLSDGSFCTNHPVEGRKRCAEHKGKRINGVNSKPIMSDLGTHSTILRSKTSSFHESDKIEDQDLSSVDVKLPLTVTAHHANNDVSTICGVILPGGFPCKQPPVPGRKRCEEHKGMRITPSILKLYTEEKSHSYELKPQTSTPVRSVPLNDCDNFCGVILSNGSICRRQPFEGRKRCTEHKGMRVDGYMSRPTSTNKSLEFNSAIGSACPFSSRASFVSSAFDFPLLCGVALANGSYCSRQPVQGRKRCWQHKGMRA
ncbi:hypothetical protein Nepgr_019911 [Nepenthes gracilis]|uniref:Protein EFFECTOR OF TRANSCRIPTION 2-like n=1 Tax=Nepenthes gracilis TaxID=150966 RepID=A0AAD3SVU2_NEPGR|nr:hypothetical protein Nepgr_019911 [Nepenthes gracilis]